MLIIKLREQIISELYNAMKKHLEVGLNIHRLNNNISKNIDYSYFYFKYDEKT
ncbi:hypothetical protein Selli1_28790 [Sellimonas catena]|uniref:Uncharacterized protein n=1 Tax=Sellimonas catena TaxID=2994035 RepID=A0A9W6CAN0_9FIRM|nr:hypothetical protein Selli1_28790 [Sellimonas catena]